MPGKKKTIRGSKRGQRYTPAQKRRILQTAAKEKLTGAEVRKRFGVSTLTFYRWRGPVRSRRGTRRSRPPQSLQGQEGKMRARARARIARIMPRIINQEVRAFLDEYLVDKQRS